MACRQTEIAATDVVAGTVDSFHDSVAKKANMLEGPNGNAKFPIYGVCQHSCHPI